MLSTPCLLESIWRFMERKNQHYQSFVSLWLLALLVRWLVALNSYSGAGKPPLFGDFEAQRHWMELTLRLPLSEWYFNSTENNLLYWGLDYPPLTAYVSYWFGLAAQWLEPELVAWQTSRGYETDSGKMFMRLSVLLCDVVLLIPAVLWFARSVYHHRNAQSLVARCALVSLVLLQPGFVLIDHGHFQYNNVCLALTLLAVVLILKDHEFLGSVCFSLALNFKQMTLYYAPAFGMFLLAKCLYRGTWGSMAVHFIKLGIAVVVTFALLWAPFCFSPSPLSSRTCSTTLAQIVHRMFPFARGLFEDKVANVWCVADLFLKIRRVVDPDLQTKLCALLTFVGFLPSVVDLIRRKPTAIRFLLSLFNCSMAFFLFSFQVHEKTILIPLLPVALLTPFVAILSGWFASVATFSMYFLLLKDGLVLPYLVLQVVFFVLGVAPFLHDASFLQPIGGLVGSFQAAPGFHADGKPGALIRWSVLASSFGMIGLHAAQYFVQPPARYPHLHDYAFASFACGHFLLALAYGTYWQWTVQDHGKSKQKTT